jgi:hypothetical protein
MQIRSKPELGETMFLPPLKVKTAQLFFASYYIIDLGVIIRLGATAVYTEGPLLEGTFFVISHYMFRPNWPSSGVAG